MLEGLRQERHQWRERLAALERLRGAMRPAPEAAPDGAALRAASREVLRLRQVLSEQPEARGVAARAVAQLEQELQQRRDAWAAERGAQQEALRRQLEVAQVGRSFLGSVVARPRRPSCCRRELNGSKRSPSGGGAWLCSVSAPWIAWKELEACT